jgi:hypothetical protein
MRITLENGAYWTFLLRAESGHTRLVQHDGDFPGVARTFGWTGSDDGTTEAIWNAYSFLEGQVGESADDPGYF